MCPCCFFGAEGGIRTHAPFRTNGFQDRLVMTASIPLQALSYSNISPHSCQEKIENNQKFFLTFLMLYAKVFKHDTVQKLDRLTKSHAEVLKLVTRRPC